jgi:hypothetical protein
VLPQVLEHRREVLKQVRKCFLIHLEQRVVRLQHREMNATIIGVDG